MSSTPEQTTPEPEKGIKGKLLIVDDETAIRWALWKTLQRMNFEIVEAETGDEAIALVRTIRFDAVLLDVGMPGMNGIEACREIRKLMPLLGIVMLTVRNTEEDKIQAFDAGADDYITKPFHLRELAARLRASVRRAHASQADDAAGIIIGEIELDPARRLVKRAGATIHLTPKECSRTNLAKQLRQPLSEYEPYREKSLRNRPRSNMDDRDAPHPARAHIGLTN